VVRRSEGAKGADLSGPQVKTERSEGDQPDGESDGQQRLEGLEQYRQ
jgi:hypothetical protein